MSFGDHGMEGELRELAERYAAAMTKTLAEIYAERSGAPVGEVESLLAGRLALAGVPFDRDEVAAYAEQISQGIAPRVA
jgi:hypothetical protein